MPFACALAFFDEFRRGLLKDFSHDFTTSTRQLILPTTIPSSILKETFVNGFERTVGVLFSHIVIGSNAEVIGRSEQTSFIVFF